MRDSTVTDAVGGHDIKSRAEQTVIVGNRIGDSAGGTSGYDIDLPNGGNATIANNVIVKGADAQNPVAIAYGEEGNVHSGSSLTVAGNTLVNNETAHLTTAVWNAAGASATVGGNSVWGWDALVSGPADASGNTVLASDPLPGGISAAISSDTLGLTAATPATFVADAATGTGTATEATENAVALSADASAASLAPVLPAASDPAAAWTWSGGTSNLDAIGAAGSAADLAAGLSGQHAAILAPAAQTGAWA